MKRESEKIELIKVGAVTAICKYGIAGASVSRIAALAGVSDGYLYRHYKSKEELLNVVLNNILDKISDKIQNLLENCSNTKEIVDGFLEYFYDNYKKNSDILKFLIIFQNDFSMKINSEVINRINNLCKEIVVLGKKEGAIREEITHIELYLSLVALPLQFLSLKYKGLFEADVVEFKQIKNIAFNSLFKI